MHSPHGTLNDAPCFKKTSAWAQQSWFGEGLGQKWAPGTKGLLHPQLRGVLQLVHL